MKKDFELFIEENGYEFLTKLGQRRNFPKEFYVQTDHEYLSQIHKTLLRASLDNYVYEYKLPKEVKITSILDYLDKLHEFIFGNKEHLGVFPVLLKNSLDKSAGNYSEFSIVEVIVACENMFLSNYKIKKINGVYNLFNDKLEFLAVLDNYKKDTVESENYVQEAHDFIESLNLTKNEILQLAYVLEVPSKEEIKFFQKPLNYQNLIKPFSYLQEENYNSFITGKRTGNFTTAILKNYNSYAVLVSPFGKVSRNYNWLTLSLAEQKIFSDMERKYGFWFVKTNPTVFIADNNGYLVNKVTFAFNDLALESLNYPPATIEDILKWLEYMGDTAANVLLRELSTLVLLKIAFGALEPSEFNIKINSYTREITSLDVMSTFINDFSYKNAGEIPDEALNLSSDYSLKPYQVVNAAKKLLQGQKFSDYESKVFDFKDALVIVDEPISSNTATSTNLSLKFFQNEYGVFYGIGKDIVQKNQIYKDDISSHIKTSGIPEFSKLALSVMNKISLFAALTYLIQEKSVKI